MEELLNDLLGKTQYSITIQINPHRDVYESVQKYVDEWGNGDERSEISPAIFEEMVKRDTIVFIQAYPHSAGGFYTVWHYDLYCAVKMACNYKS